MNVWKKGLNPRKHRKLSPMDLEAQELWEKYSNPYTATSILNDRAFTIDAVKGLLDVGKILYSTRDIEFENMEEMLSLGDKQLNGEISTVE